MKLNKNWLAASCVIAALPSLSSGFMETGQGALVADVSATAEYDSNIFANYLEEDDFVGRLSTVLRYTQQSGVMHADVSAGLVGEKFLDYDEQDSLDFRSRVLLTGMHRPDAKTDFRTTVGFNQYSEANAQVGDRVQRDVIDASVSVSHQYSQKLGVDTALKFANNSYDEARYNGSQDWSVRLGGFYVYSPKLDFTYGYRFRYIDNDFGIVPEQNSHTFDIGARGELLSKVTGHVSIGYSYQEELDDFIYYSIGADWAVTEKSTLSVVGSQDTNPSPSGSASTESDLTVRWTQQMRSHFAVFAGASIGMLELEGGTNARDDEIYGAHGGFNYNIGQNTTLRGLVTYENRDSDAFYAEYERWTASLTGTVSF